MLLVIALNVVWAIARFLLAFGASAAPPPLGVTFLAMLALAVIVFAEKG